MILVILMMLVIVFMMLMVAIGRGLDKCNENGEDKMREMVKSFVKPLILST
jgi:competence protein ComGC